MSKNMAVVNENGLVENIIICQDDEPETSNLITYTEDNPAYIGGDYVNGFFYPEKPFASWTRDEKGGWISPVPKPDSLGWLWNESEQQWQQQPEIS